MQILDLVGFMYLYIFSFWENMTSCLYVLFSPHCSSTKERLKAHPNLYVMIIELLVRANRDAELALFVMNKVIHNYSICLSIHFVISPHNFSMWSRVKFVFTYFIKSSLCQQLVDLPLDVFSRLISLSNLQCLSYIPCFSKFKWIKMVQSLQVQNHFVLFHTSSKRLNQIPVTSIIFIVSAIYDPTPKFSNELSHIIL